MDWGFVGGAYEAADIYQDNQTLINWYPETDRNPGAKTVTALLGVPGLEQAVSSSFTGEVRGGHVMPGGNTAYMVIGSVLVKIDIATPATSSSYATLSLTNVGSLVTSSGQVCMRDNGVEGVLVIVDGSWMYVYLTKTGVFQQVPDANVINPSRLASIDGYILWNEDGSQKFNASPVYWNGTDAFDGTMFALADNASDNLVTLIEDQRQIWLIGERHYEVWINQGNTSLTGVSSFPFGRLEGAMKQVGCAAKNSIVRTGHGLCWLGSSERGENYVVLTEGYEFKSISTPALSYAMTNYKVIEDAFAYTYTEEGHEFYVLTFPTQDVTWVYDFTTSLWHQRQTVYPDGTTHRQRANCCINFAGQRLVGDYQTGQIWRQSRNIYVDGDRPLVASRRTPYVWDQDARNRVRHYRLQIEFAPGVGISSGQGQDPQIQLRWKDENGWSNWRLVPIGKQGEARNRAIARRLGAARSRVYEVLVSDPVKRDVVGASLRPGETTA